MEQREEFELAGRTAKMLQNAVPRVVEAYYDKRRGRIVVRLNTRVDLAFAPADVQGLENATPAQLSVIEVSPSGFGLQFPKLDADIYVPALLEGFLGSKNWMARRLGEQGGRSKSPAKALAARENGRLGGRPKKKADRVA